MSSPRRPSTTYRAGDDTAVDKAVDGLFAGVLFFTPLAFGGTEAWSQQIWFGLIAAIGISVLAKRLFDRESPFVFTWAYLPIVLFLLLISLQLVPLSRGLMQSLSPGTVALRDDLLADRSPATSSISLYRFVTWQQLRLVLAASAIFAIVLHAYRSPERIRRLLLIVTFAGLAVAGVAAYQDVMQATLIYGSVPIGHKNAGPFQNYSHFSQFMNLSVGGAVALIAMTLATWSENGRGKVEWAEEFRRPGNAIYFWPAAVLIVAGPILVLASMSRMGMISLLVAGAVTAGLVGWRGNRGRSGKYARGRPGGLFLVLTYGVCAAAILAGVGFEVVYDRLATVANVDTTAGVRWQILKDLTAVYRQFPVFGTGLGTHEFVYPQFSHTNDIHLYAYAENEYAQLLEEAGGVGLLLAVSFIAVVGAALLRAIAVPKRPVQFAAFGLGFGLVAILVHSFSDFGQHVPANACLTAIFCALLINIATIAKPVDAVVAVPAKGRSPAWAGVALAAFLVGAGWVIYRADVARRAESAFADGRFKASELEAAGWQGDDAAFIGMLESAGRAVELEPANATYAHWLGAYRWQTIARDAADRTTRQLSFTEESLDFARQVVAGLDDVRQLCPTFGPPLSLAGQIRLLALGDTAGQGQVRTAYRLAPYSRAVCYAAGTLATRWGDWDLAASALGHYIKLDGPRWHVVDTYLLANRPDLAFEIAKADRWNLRRLADGLAANWPKEAARVAECRALDEKMLIEESDRPNARPDALIERATNEQQKGHTEQAVMWYQKAVDTDYGRVDWRMALARAQAAVGQRDEAARNLRICLRLRPKWQEAESLLADYASGRSGPIRGK